MWLLFTFGNTASICEPRKILHAYATELIEMKLNGERKNLLRSQNEMRKLKQCYHLFIARIFVRRSIVDDPPLIYIHQCYLHMHCAVFSNSPNELAKQSVL